MRQKLALVLFFAALSSPNPLFSQAKIALVLGVNEYDLLSPLNAAVNDSEKVASYYRGLGFKVVLQNDRQENRMDRPSLPNFQRALSNIADSSREGGISELVFFFAGHGLQIAGENFLCFPETQLQDRSGMLSVDSVLVPWLRDNQAKLTMVYLDACRNDLGPVRAAGVTRGLEVVSAGPALAENGRSMAVFYASKAGEFSYEKPDGSNGFFTDVLLEGLQADSTRTIIDLFNYVKRALPSRTEAAYGKPQIPRLGGDIETEAVFSKGRVDLSAYDTGGRLYVETDRPGADVLVNGVKRGVSPLLVEGLSPGPALVEARMPGLYASEQVSIVRKALARTSLAMKELTGNLLLNSFRASSSEIGGEIVSLVQKEVEGLDLLIDDRLFAKVSGPLVPKIPLGNHTVALSGNGFYWEGKVAFEGNDTVKVDPLLEPVGFLEYSFPEAAHLLFEGPEGDLEMIVEGREGTLPRVRAGEYSVTITTASYEPVAQRFSIVRGGKARIAPQFEYTALKKKSLQIEAIRDQMEKNRALLPSWRSTRGTLDAVAWASAGTGVALGIASGLLYFLAGDAYAKYLAEPDSVAAAALHDKVSDYKDLSVRLGIGGAGLLSASILPFCLGPRPAKIMELDKAFNAELDNARRDYEALQLSAKR